MRVTRQTWVSLTQWKVRAERKRITSQKAIFDEERGIREGGEPRDDAEKTVSKNKDLSIIQLMNLKEVRLYL